MIKYKKTIENMFESWGKANQEVPRNNDALKMKILSKFPVNLDRKISNNRGPLFWLPFAFTAFAVFVLFINVIGYRGNVGIQNINQIGTQRESLPTPTSDTYKSTSSSAMPYYEGGELPLSDNREFLKVDYNAAIRTRRIDELKDRIETIVRGSGGRVDSSSGGDKYGYVSFAIPKSGLENFKSEIKDLAGARFYVEQTSSQNLLRDKQIIEENQKQTEKSLSSLQSERAQIVKNHNQSISSQQSRINFLNRQINSLNLEYQTATLQRRAEIANTINQLLTEINTIQSDIANENESYKVRINNIDAQIKNTQNNLSAIHTQDTNLLNSVATVNGSISLSWISLWEIADAYLPGPLLTWILLLAAFLSFLWNRYTRMAYDSFDFS